MAPIQTPEPNRTIQDSGHNVEASLPKNRTPEAERGLRIPTSPARCNRTLRQVIEDLENANVSPSSGTRNRLEANLPSPDLSAVAELLSISKQQKNELRFGFEGLQTQSTADVAPSADWERKFGEHEGRFNEQDAKLDDLNDRMKVFQAHVAKERAVMAKVHGMKLLLLAAERLCGVQSLRRENKEESAGKDSEKGNGVGSRGRETKDDEDTPDEANTYSSSRSPTEVDSTEGVCLSDIVTKKTALHNLREVSHPREGLQLAISYRIE